MVALFCRTILNEAGGAAQMGPWLRSVRPDVARHRSSNGGVFHARGAGLHISGGVARNDVEFWSLRDRKFGFCGEDGGKYFYFFPDAQHDGATCERRLSYRRDGRAQPIGVGRPTRRGARPCFASKACHPPMDSHRRLSRRYFPNLFVVEENGCA